MTLKYRKLAHRPETKAKIAASLRGRTVSKETRARQSRARRAYLRRLREEEAAV
jgi:hypothetical protein